MIKKADIRGSLDNYFITPKIKRLYFYKVTWNLNRRRNASEPRNFRLKYPFYNVPQLEILIFDHTSGDDSLIEVLQDCHLLQQFTVMECISGSFLQSFVNGLCNTNSFPNLQLFCTKNAWYDINIRSTSYKDFCSLMKSQRPHLVIKGNGASLIPVDFGIFDEDDAEGSDEDENSERSGSDVNVSFAHSDQDDEAEQEDYFDFERDMLAIFG
jgi:hypothetical protein